MATLKLFGLTSPGLLCSETQKQISFEERGKLMKEIVALNCCKNSCLCKFNHNQGDVSNSISVVETCRSIRHYSCTKQEKYNLGKELFNSKFNCHWPLSNL